nr:MAG TPA: hypothetical protein [Caudoviricetes sp.]
MDCYVNLLSLLLDYRSLVSLARYFKEKRENLERRGGGKVNTEGIH